MAINQSGEFEDKLSTPSEITDQPINTSCIYCAGRSGDTTMSLEHIWPQALGGESAPDLFKTNMVCRTCNNTMGQWVDGSFIKSWFISMERALSAHSYLDPNKPQAAPLLYWGFDEDIVLDEDHVCERWSGMAEEKIYHIHRKDHTRWHTYAGGDIIRRKRKDPGRIYFFLRSPDDYWFLTLVLSIASRFPRAKYRCLTKIEGFPGPLPFAQLEDKPISEQETREMDWIIQNSNSFRHTRAPMSIDFPDRFQAKLALGLAYNILGPQAVFSSYGNQLRKLLWSRNTEDRLDLSLRGTGWWAEGGMSDAPDIFKWPKGWIVFLKGYPDAFGMTLCAPTGRCISMMMSDDPTLWKADLDHTLSQGVVFIFIPHRNISVGPISMLDYVSHCIGRREHPELKSIADLQVKPEQLPAKAPEDYQSRATETRPPSAP